MRKEVLTYMKHGYMIETVYMSSGNVISKRRLTVHSIKNDKLRAYCHLRHAYRTFYFDRMLAVFPVIYNKKAVELHGE